MALHVGFESDASARPYQVTDITTSESTLSTSTAATDSPEQLRRSVRDRRPAARMLFFEACNANGDAYHDTPREKRRDLNHRSSNLTQHKRLSGSKQTERQRHGKQDLKAHEVKHRPRKILKVHRSSSNAPKTFRPQSVGSKCETLSIKNRQDLLRLSGKTELPAVDQNSYSTLESRKPRTPATVAATRPISRGVAAQVKLVRDYISQFGSDPSVLDRDPTRHSIITVPESALLAAVLTMRNRYEVGKAWNASIFDMEEAIVRRFSKPFGQRASLDFVTIDAAKETAFVAKIQRKIRGHGVSSKTNLLEVQLEMNTRELLEQCGAAGHGEDDGKGQQ